MARIVHLDKAPTTQLTNYGAYEDGPEEAFMGTMTLPVRDQMNAATVTSLLYTDWSFAKERFIQRGIIQGGILTLQRNEAVSRMRGDWLLFIDDDMVWEPKDIERLVQTRDELDADIVGALCYRRSSPHQPTLFMRETPTSGGYNYLEDWDTDVVEVDATGMAFVIIHKRVFEKIAGSPMPPIEVRRTMTPSNFFKWEGVLGEDLRFCQDAKNVGCRIFVDTRIEVGHMAEVEIRRKQFLLAALERPEETELERRTINDRMGLPTLDAGRIHELLGW